VVEQEQRIERIKMAKKTTPPTKKTVAPKTAPPAATASRTPATPPQKTAAPTPTPKPAAASPATKPAPAKKAAKASTPTTVPSVTPEARWQMISEAAYFLAEKRGFAGGNPCDDWIEAEAQVDALLKHRADRKK
jgi:hypothetical protein